MEDLDAIQARHRRELRELQGRITNKKKNATKKTRKGVLDECAALERALREQQAAELARWEAGGEGGREGDGGAAEADGADVSGVAAQLGDVSLAAEEAASRPTAGPAGDGGPPGGPAGGPKRNRQKERLARRAAEQAAAAAAAADEASHMVDHAAAERAALAPLIARAGRVEHAIRPDGHCLFSAVADQLGAVGRSVRAVRAVPAGAVAAGAVAAADLPADTPAFRVVRHAAADYMAAHADDFAPFLLAGEGDGGDAPDLEAHVAQIRDTAAWGGQPELAALASAYGVDIEVLHDGRSERIQPASGNGSDGGSDGGADGKGGGDADRPTLWLVYYRHGFGLGEHYNSLRAKAAAA